MILIKKNIAAAVLCVCLHSFLPIYEESIAANAPGGAAVGFYGCAGQGYHA
jgi:hypothetical protein